MILNKSCSKYRDKANFYIKKKSLSLEKYTGNHVTISFSEKCLPAHIDFIKRYMNYNKNVFLVLDKLLHKNFCFEEFSQRVMYVDIHNPYIFCFYSPMFICFGDEEYTNLLTEHSSRYAYMNLFNEQNLFFNFIGAIHMSMNDFFLFIKNKNFFYILERRFSPEVTKYCKVKYEENVLYEIFEKDVLKFKVQSSFGLLEFYNHLFENSLPRKILLKLLESNHEDSNYMYISLGLDFPIFKATIGRLLYRWIIFENSVIYKSKDNIKFFK